MITFGKPNAEKFKNEKLKPIQEICVLVVDDQLEMLGLMRKMIREMGVVNISEAKDADSALNAFRMAPEAIDVVLSDWNMPGLTGVEFLRELRQIKPSITFLMVTGRSDADSVVEAKKSGVTSYILKPFSPQQLEARLRIALYGRSA
jgi:two-component system, chemotaxis family, chemotaxis protein CheY